MSLADLEAELPDFRQRCVSGLLMGALPGGFLQVFNALPDRPFEKVLRFLPAKQVVQMRGVSRKWNQLIKKASKSMQKKGYDAVVIKINGKGHLSFEWVDQVNGWTRKTTQIGEGAPLSELLRFIRIDGTIFFGDGLSATDDVLEQMTKAWLTIRPQRLVFSGELKGTSADSLRAFLAKVEPFVRLLHFQNAIIPDDLLSDRVVAAAGRLDGLLVLPMSRGFSDPPVVNIGDGTLASMGGWNKMPSYIFFCNCLGATTAGIRAFVENWIKYECAVAIEELHTDGAYVWGDEKSCELTFYQCPNITAEAVEEACGDLLKKEKYTSVDWSDRFTIAFGASHRRLCVQFNDASRKHLIEQPMLQFHFNDGDSFDLDQEDDLDDPDMYDFEDDYDPEDGVDYDDFRQRCVSGLLTGALPDGFLQVFNALPDRPFEHVLRFLPAKQVVQMRGVSRKWNQLIKKASKSMPKKGYDVVEIKINGEGHLSFEWVDQVNGWTQKTTQIGEGAPLSELLRFIRIDGTIFFGDGLSATDDVLEQMTKAWLTIRPQRLVFSGELKGTSANSLRPFLAKVEPFVRLLHFQNAIIPDDLLSDRVVAAAGRLDGLLVLPMSWGPDPPVVNIGDETLASMGGWNKMPSYIFFRNCSGATTAGIRAFVENWIKYEGAVAIEELHTDGANVWGDEKLCELTFYQCPNITAEAVEEACGDLLKKEKYTSVVVVGRWSGGDQQGEDRFTIAFGASHRRLCVQFNDASRKHLLEQPMLQFHFNEDSRWSPFGDYDPEDYDDYDEDTDLD